MNFMLWINDTKFTNQAHIFQEVYIVHLEFQLFQFPVKLVINYKKMRRLKLFDWVFVINDNIWINDLLRYENDKKIVHQLNWATWRPHGRWQRSWMCMSSQIERWDGKSKHEGKGIGFDFHQLRSLVFMAHM